MVAILCALAGVAGAAPRMVKGPYLQNVAPDAITIMWELDEPVPASLVITGPAGSRAIDAPADRVAEVRVDKLQPGTRYHYQVTVGESHWDGDLATAPPDGADVPFSFVVFGDSRNGIEQHRRVLDRVIAEAPAFVLATGDMVDEGYNEDQWQAFFDVEQKLMGTTVLFPALGNHDRQGRGRTADTYRTYFAVPDNGGAERYYAFTYASARIIVLDSNSNSFSLTDQTAWLERELIAARQDPLVRHIFIVMHHPPFSVSLHGGAVDLRERWTPLFEKYQVSAVFSGHDHVYERAEHDGIHYFVSGGGGAPLYPRRPQPNPVDAEAVVKFERTLHYLRVNVTSDRVEVSGVRPDGTIIETESWADGPGTPVADAVRTVRAGARASQGTVAAERDRRRWWLFVVGGLLVLAVAAVLARKRAS